MDSNQNEASAPRSFYRKNVGFKHIRADAAITRRSANSGGAMHTVLAQVRSRSGLILGRGRGCRVHKLQCQKELSEDATKR